MPCPLLHSLLVKPSLHAGFGFPLVDWMSFFTSVGENDKRAFSPPTCLGLKPTLSLNYCFFQPLYGPLTDSLVTMAPPGHGASMLAQKPGNLVSLLPTVSSLMTISFEHATICCMLRKSPSCLNSYPESLQL